MSLEYPHYWLAYLSDAADVYPDEVTAIAPEILQRSMFSRSTQVLLATADRYHDSHSSERVVFAAAITRWLHVEHGREWHDLDVDFDDALDDLDQYAPALLIQASPIARAIVANAAIHLEIVRDNWLERADVHTEPVREAIHMALQRDWRPYITRIAARS
jgi:hypothetical protein